MTESRCVPSSDVAWNARLSNTDMRPTKNKDLLILTSWICPFAIKPLEDEPRTLRMVLPEREKTDDWDRWWYVWSFTSPCDSVLIKPPKDQQQSIHPIMEQWGEGVTSKFSHHKPDAGVRTATAAVAQPEVWTDSRWLVWVGGLWWWHVESLMFHHDSFD